MLSQASRSHSGGGPWNDTPPEVNTGRWFPVPALCARGLLANLEWHSPTAGGLEKG